VVPWRTAKERMCAMKYGDLTLGQIEAIGNKLGGPEGIRRFLAGELVVREPDFKVFKTVKLGTGPKTAEDFRLALMDGGMKISEWADNILGQPAFTVAPEATMLDLVVLTPADLGFKDGAKREDIYASAKSRGLQLCPAEVGPQLRLAYRAQPKGEWLVIGMEPITASDGTLGLFRVERRGDGLWLDGHYAHPDYVWGGCPHFVFVLPRK